MEANKGVTILLIEDDPINQITEKKALQRENYNVIIAGTGYEGLKLLKEKEIDLVLVDIRLPDISGFDVIRAIRKMDKEQNTHTPIITVTAYAMQSDKEKCLAAGADEYISKPLSIWTLYAAIKRLLFKKDAL